MELDEKSPVIPGDLIATFARCRNYPTDQAALLFLAQGLRKASDSTGVAMELIVERCAETSPFCPTDADLFAAGRLIRDEIQRRQASLVDQKAEWREKYGRPEPFLIGKALASVDIHSQKSKDAEMWRRVRTQLHVKAPTCKDVSWPDIYHAMDELGYELTNEQRRMMR